MRAAWLVVCGALACGGSKDEPARPRGTVARFDLPATGAIAWGAVPFPSDLYLGDDGTVDLASPPPGVADEPIWTSIVDDLNQRKGFCATCAVYFGVEGVVGTAKDGVVMLDPDGKTIATQLEWNADDSVLAVRPVPWVVLQRNARYIVALTDKVMDADGAPLRAAPVFAAARDGGGDAAAARARKVVSPALEALARAGVARGSVVSIASFTTGDPTADPLAARKLAHATKPVATVTKLFSGATALDELFGVPASATPGLGMPAKDPSLGKWALAHDSVAHVVYGSFESPHVRTGAAEDGGKPLRNGLELTAKGTERVPFMLALPKTGELATLPVVVVLTGAGSSAGYGMVLADTLARVGVATLAIDPPCQGGRGKGAVDRVNEFRGGHPVPDGIPESNNVDGALRCIGVIGPAPGQKAHPSYLSGYGLQSETDLFVAIRLVRDGDWTSVRKDALATLGFDPAKIFLLGNHGGTVYATALAATEPDLAGVVLNAVGFSLVETMTEAPGGRLSAANIYPALGLRADLDEVTRRYLFHPALDLFRFVAESSEARALLPYVYGQPLGAGRRPDILVQRPALDEYINDEQVASAAVTLGIPVTAAMPQAPVTVATPPLSGNVMTKSGVVTAGISVVPDGLARMLFFAEEASAYEPPFTPPARARPKTLTLPNPVAAVHAQIATFVSTRTIAPVK